MMSNSDVPARTLIPKLLLVPTSSDQREGVGAGEIAGVLIRSADLVLGTRDVLPLRGFECALGRVVVSAKLGEGGRLSLSLASRDVPHGSRCVKNGERCDAGELLSAASERAQRGLTGRLGSAIAAVDLEVRLEGADLLAVVVEYRVCGCVGLVGQPDPLHLDVVISTPGINIAPSSGRPSNLPSPEMLINFSGWLLRL